MTASGYWDEVNERNAAVGIECRAMKAFERDLEPSSRAAAGDGPNTGIPT